MEKIMTSISVSGEAFAKLKTLVAEEGRGACVRLRTYAMGSG